MRILITFIVLATFALPVAQAEPVATPWGAVAVDEHGWLFYVDGNGNPTEVWVAVDLEGTTLLVCVDDNGAPMGVDPTKEPESPTCLL